MKIKQTLSVFLAAAMIAAPASLMTSCGGGGGANATTAVNASADAQSTASADPLAGLGANDFGGKTFLFLDRNAFDTHWETLDIYAENETGETLNDAVFKRNSMVQDRYNVVIQQSEIDESKFSSTVQKAVKAGSDDFQAVNYPLSYVAALALQGAFTNFADLPVLDLSQPCWDSFVNRALTINSRGYFIEGDLNVGFNDASWLVMFNKKMAADLGLDDQYQNVADGTWTLDMMLQNSKLATKDLNGDGKLYETDQWGTCDEYGCMYALYTSSGQRAFTKDANDLPVCAMDANTQQLTIMQNVWDFLHDQTAQITAEAYQSKYPTDPWTPVEIDTFREGRALYYISPVESVKFMRDMNSDFGLLPVPKTDPNQSDYYNSIQYYNAEFISVPISNTDGEFTGTVLQAMGLASAGTVRTAYYDVQLKDKYARDNDSVNMLDYIFKNRIVDLGIAFDWGGSYEFYTNLVKANTFDYASAYAKISKKVQSDMAKAITAFTA